MILARDALLEAFPGKPRASGDDPGPATVTAGDRM